MALWLRLCRAALPALLDHRQKKPTVRTALTGYRLPASTGRSAYATALPAYARRPRRLGRRVRLRGGAGLTVTHLAVRKSFSVGKSNAGHRLLGIISIDSVSVTAICPCTSPSRAKAPSAARSARPLRPRTGTHDRGFDQTEFPLEMITEVRHGQAEQQTP